MNNRLRFLQRSIVSALSECPLVLAVEPFGSIAAGTDDEYSDVDLRVTVDDLPAVLAARHALLGGVGPVAVEWIVHDRPGSFCSSVLFAEESFYHKADIEFRAAEPTANDAALNWPRAGHNAGVVYIPAPGEPGHFLVGQLLGGVRYAKARRRGQNLTCWRFFSAIVDSACALLFEKADHWQSVNGKLTTEQYLALDAAVDAATVQQMFADIDLSRSEKMDAGVLRLLDQIVELTARKGEIVDQPIPKASILRLSLFLKAELSHRSESVYSGE